MMHTMATNIVTLSNQRLLQLGQRQRQRWLPSSLLLLLLLMLFSFLLLFAQLSAFTVSVSAFANSNNRNRNIDNHKQRDQVSFFNDATADVCNVKGKGNPLLFAAPSPLPLHNQCSLYLSSSNENENSNEGTESIPPTTGSSQSTNKETKVTNTAAEKKKKKPTTNRKAEAVPTTKVYYQATEGNVKYAVSFITIDPKNDPNTLLLKDFKHLLVEINEWNEDNSNRQIVFSTNDSNKRIPYSTPLLDCITNNSMDYPLLVEIGQRDTTGSIQDGTYSKFNFFVLI
jgi:cytochrome oxidase Cu insertion factor (SCO1/SenC/PrrC family)